MPDSSLPAAVAGFLSARGASDAASSGLSDPAALVRAFRLSAPSEVADPLSPPALAWVSAALDCLGVMDERLYEHYRAMIDLIRGHLFRPPAEALLSAPDWRGPVEKALRLGLLPEDRYGADRARPHIGRLPDYLWEKVSEKR